MEVDSMGIIAILSTKINQITILSVVKIAIKFSPCKYHQFYVNAKIFNISSPLYWIRHF